MLSSTPPMWWSSHTRGRSRSRHIDRAPFRLHPLQHHQATAAQACINSTPSLQLQQLPPQLPLHPHLLPLRQQQTRQIYLIATTEIFYVNLPLRQRKLTIPLASMRLNSFIVTRCTRLNRNRLSRSRTKVIIWKL